MKSRKLLPDALYRFTPKRAVSRIYQKLTGKRDDSYCRKDKPGTFKCRVRLYTMSVAEIYSITDIHVLDGTGISIRQMKHWMPDYDLILYAILRFFWDVVDAVCHETETKRGRAQSGQGP